MEYNDKKENLENFFQGLQTGELVEEFKNGAVEIPVKKLEPCIYLKYGDDDKAYCCNAVRHFSRYCDFTNTKEICKYAKFDNQQSAKADSGKPRLSLVPASLERAVCAIREYGTKKYNNDSENWKQVEPQRYFEAILRHTNAMRENGIYSCDEESGLQHLHHVACSISFLIEFENMKNKGVQND